MIEPTVHHEKSPMSATTTSKEPSLEGDFIEVTFDENDPRNPVNFSKGKKWAIAVTASSFTFLAASSATSYNMGFPSMTHDLGCSELQATAGLSVYAFGFGAIPLVASSFSEEFGRRPLYIISIIGFSLMHLMVALATNIQTVIIARFLQGAFGSTGATVVAGTITDMWPPNKRGLPMCMFSASGFVANGLAAVAGGWIEANPHLKWRWIQWIHLILAGVYCAIAPFILAETRSDILLLRIANNLTKKNVNLRSRYRIKAYAERPSLRTLIWISFSRPIYLLCTEPIVISNSVWIGFAWGIFYCMIESIPGVFKTLYNFSTGEVGTVFVTMALLGFITNLLQEKLYQKYYSTRHAEARLYVAFVAAFLFPIGMFIYAWSAQPDLFWLAPIIGITVYIWATFTIYVAVFTYLADCYGPYASSALAGQSLFRNLMAAIFPLFIQKMFGTLTYKWANTLFACIALFMIPIPYVLFFYGPVIRRWSKFSIQ